MARQQLFHRGFIGILCLMTQSISIGQVTRTFTEPDERIEVSAAELGIVQSVNVRVGEAVTKGQLLGQLNSDVLIVSRRLAQFRAASTARSDAARADLQLKQSMYLKLMPLLQSGHANATELERSKTELEQAEAAFRIANNELAEAKIELARIDAQLSQRQIRSPINGIVIDIHRKPGEYLPANDPRFATVVDVSKLRARFFVSTAFAEQLRPGGTMKLQVGASSATATGLIEFVSPITESESGTVRIDVLIDNVLQKYRSGVTCLIAETAAEVWRTTSQPTDFRAPAEVPRIRATRNHNNRTVKVADESFVRQED